MNTHHANVVQNRTRTESIHRTVSVALIAAFAICVLSCAQNCAAEGPLIKPAKWGLKWPFKKKKAAESVDPFNELGAAQQHDLAASITGEHSQPPPSSSPPAIQAANGYAAVPGSAAPYPWPNPIDSSNPAYTSKQTYTETYTPAQTPVGNLYPNPGIPSGVVQSNTRPSRPVLTPPVTPAVPNGGSLYPQTSRSRVAGTSVTVPTPNPTGWAGPQYASANAGSLYPTTANSRANPSTGSLPTIVPNYARDSDPKSDKMRVTTISPGTGRSRQVEISNETQQVTATGPAIESNQTYLPPQPPSSRLSSLPARDHASIKAEPSVPKKPIVAPQPTTPIAQTYSPPTMPRVAMAAAGVPAVAQTQANGTVQNGPYFDPEARPNYDDQYGWQTGAAKSSRKSWGGPSFGNQPPGSARPASATTSESASPPVVPAIPVVPTVLPTQSSPPPASNLPQAPPQPTTTAPTTATPAPPANASPAAAPTATPPALPLPLPPLTGAVEQIKKGTADAIDSVKIASAAVGDSVSNLNSRVELAAHTAVDQTVNHIQHAASAVLNTPQPAANPNSFAPAQTAATVAQVDMTSAWPPVQSQPAGAMALPPAAPMGTVVGQAAHVAPATPNMNSAFPTGNNVAPATPAATPLPRLDGSFRPSEVDQSIWGNQERRPRPTAAFVQPPAQMAPAKQGPAQASVNMAVPPRNPNRTPQPGANPAARIATNPSSVEPQAPNPALGDLDQASQVIAVVGDQSILAGDLLWQINQMLKPYIGQAPEEELNKQRALLMEKMLPRLVENKLVYLDFLRTVPPGKMPEIRKQVIEEFNKSKMPDLMKKAKVNSPAAMDAKLRELGSSLSKQQQMFLEQIVGRQMVQQNVDARSEVTHDEMLEYYREHAEDYDLTAQARWERLMVRWDQFPSRKEAEAALGQLGNEVLRGTPFKAAAKRGSQGPRASQGGFYDWTQKDSLKSELIDNLLFTLPVGRLSKVIRDDEGAHIIRVVERREAGRVAFDKVQSKITDAIQAQRFKDEVEVYLNKLNQETTVWTAFDTPRGPVTP